MDALNNFLFIGLPYITLFVFIVGSIYRYRNNGFSVSSFSSQFLEPRKLFWGSVPFHWGVVFIFFGHLLAFLIPQGVLAWNSDPLRLIVLEVTGFVFGISMLWGIIALFIRRITNRKLKVVTSKMDLAVEILLILQVILGLWVAYELRWGSSWFASVLTPYLWSIFKLSPETAAVVSMPWQIQAHIVGAFLIILLIPFSRLMHLLVVPIQYLWRPWQQVIWYRDRRKVHDPENGWTVTKPKNN